MPKSIEAGPDDDTSNDGLAPVIPHHILALLGPGPGVTKEEEDLFNQLRTQFVADFKPGSIDEWIALHDIAVITWEIRQFREHKTSLFKVKNNDYAKHRSPVYESSKRKLEIQGEKLHSEVKAMARKYGLKKIENGEIQNEELDNKEMELRLFESAWEFVESEPLVVVSKGESPTELARRQVAVIQAVRAEIEEIEKIIILHEKRRERMWREFDRRRAITASERASRQAERAGITDIDSSAA